MVHCSIYTRSEGPKRCSDFQVYFKISIKADKCPAKGKSETIKIKPLGFTEEVEVVLNFICDCQCADNGEPFSEKCHQGNGTFECGACK